jgi:hypothetical protein
MHLQLAIGASGVTEMESEPDEIRASAWIEEGDDATARIGNENAENGGDTACRHCGEVIEQPAGVWQHSRTTSTQCTDEDEDDPDSTHAEPEPLHWLNSARVTADPDEDAVHLAVSIGDPRGAWVMTVRRIPDDAETNAGALVLHVPHPGDSMPHTGLRRLHDGTYLVCAYEDRDQ